MSDLGHVPKGLKRRLSVDRTANMPLGEQLFQGLRKAIVRGVYKPGETLPSLQDLAEAAGVSEKVSRRALARLTEIGWCESRRGARAIVVDRGKSRRGRILFFSAETGLGFHSSQLVGALRSRLLKSDYCLTAIAAYDMKRDGSSRILAESLKERWDLVVEMGMRPGSRREIERAGWPFLVLGDGGRCCIPSEAANYIGQVPLLNGLAVPAFIQACAQKRVRSVVQFLLDGGGFDVSEPLAAQGIACTSVHVHNVHSPFGLYRGAYAAMESLLGKAGGVLPDVFLFTDDHFAHGGLLSLMARGIRVPEDVKVVTHANRGLGPFWVKPLTRLEMDPVAQGAAVAEAVLDYFRAGQFPEGLCLGSTWCVGETF